ncbi:hypothetical protein Pse7367_2864 [Thalassoporum mexicanum PCC 7367]|uniref:hypothetical protein n=1 Tax=Thalassoporum mexicanum TaxID=3457544 RepID=UPI00029FBD35|nr:hypothetical protein [Pseudanabaena sp. PCC 7367]AFY71117.1 hypothetical protein Pse7367_2864 [Pseudanabaena sp. PCC 7367]
MRTIYFFTLPKHLAINKVTITEPSLAGTRLVQILFAKHYVPLAECQREYQQFDKFDRSWGLIQRFNPGHLA